MIRDRDADDLSTLVLKDHEQQSERDRRYDDWCRSATLFGTACNLNRLLVQRMHACAPTNQQTLGGENGPGAREPRCC